MISYLQGFDRVALDVKSWPLLIAASAGFVVFGFLLVAVITSLVRSNRRQIVATGPLVAEQEFELKEAQPLLLLVEVPRLGSGFRNLEFQVTETATGRVTSLSYNFLRAQGAVYGVTTMRVPIGRIEMAPAGPYLVRVLGLHNGRRFVTQPNHALETLSWANGSADHWNRALRHWPSPQPLVWSLASVTASARLDLALSFLIGI